MFKTCVSVIVIRDNFCLLSSKNGDGVLKNFETFCAIFKHLMKGMFTIPKLYFSYFV